MSKFTENSLSTFSAPVIQQIIGEAIELGWFTVEEFFDQQKTGRYNLLPPAQLKNSTVIMEDTQIIVKYKGKTLIVPEAVGDFNIRKNGLYR
jgi:hypothetical protein